MSFTFRAFRAVDEPESCERFHLGHSKILEDLGIKKLTSNYTSWMEDPNVFVIMATSDEDGELAGGIRVQKWAPERRLPLATALAEMDPRIHHVLEVAGLRGTAESCGLWNARRVFGKGISPLLARCSVALSATLDVKSLYCFSAPYTLEMIKSLGFTEVEDLGDHGRFPYPSEKYISSVLVISDLYMLSRAQELQRERIFSLMENPVQSFAELSQSKELEINYKLLCAIKVKERSHMYP